MIIDLSPLLDFALLALRIVVAIIFFSSGKSHIMKPVERGQGIGFSPGAARLLGITEITGALSVAVGIYIQVGAVLLIGVMLGAIYKKVFEWKTGFYSKEGFGWHYDLLLLCANLVFLVTGGNLILVE